VEVPIIAKNKEKGAAGPEFNREHAHCFLTFLQVVHREFVPPNTAVNSEFYCDVLRRLREKPGNLAQTQLPPSSKKRVRPQVPENHRV
jgi:hypothetical protein